jgi:large subunit ribosomal protein L9
MAKRKKEKKIPVLLLDDLLNLGQRGEVVSVKPGYFRYLISQKKVALATKEKLKNELKPFLLEEKIKSRVKEAEKLKEEIEKLNLEFKISKYVPKITKEKIVKTLKEKGFNISKSQVHCESALDKAGEYNVIIKLSFGLSAVLKIKIIQS